MHCWHPLIVKVSSGPDSHGTTYVLPCFEARHPHGHCITAVLPCCTTQDHGTSDVLPSCPADEHGTNTVLPFCTAHDIGSTTLPCCTAHDHRTCTVLPWRRHARSGPAALLPHHLTLSTSTGISTGGGKAAPRHPSTTGTSKALQNLNCRTVWLSGPKRPELQQQDHFLSSPMNCSKFKHYLSSSSSVSSRKLHGHTSVHTTLVTIIDTFPDGRGSGSSTAAALVAMAVYMIS